MHSGNRADESVDVLADSERVQPAEVPAESGHAVTRVHTTARVIPSARHVLCERLANIRAGHKQQRGASVRVAIEHRHVIPEHPWKLPTQLMELALEHLAHSLRTLVGIVARCFTSVGELHALHGHNPTSALTLTLQRLLGSGACDEKTSARGLRGGLERAEDRPEAADREALRLQPEQPRCSTLSVVMGSP